MRDTSRLGDANERGQLLKHWKSLFKRCGSASRIFFPSNNVSAAGFDMRRSTDATGDARTWYDAGQQSGQRVQLGDFLGRQQYTRFCQAYVCVRRIRRARQGKSRARQARGPRGAFAGHLHSTGQRASEDAVGNDSGWRPDCVRRHFTSVISEAAKRLLRTDGKGHRADDHSGTSNAPQRTRMIIGGYQDRTTHVLNSRKKLLLTWRSRRAGVEAWWLPMTRRSASLQ